MEIRNFFDFHAYCAKLVKANKFAQVHDFTPCTCSGISQLQGVLDRFATNTAFVCSDEVTTGETFMNGKGGYFQRRTFTVFVLHRYSFGDEDSRIAALSYCRELTRQLQSRMLKDRRRLDDALVFLNLEDVPVTELGEYFATGCTGLYFMMTLSEPLNLCYDKSQWLDEE